MSSNSPPTAINIPPEISAVASQLGVVAELPHVIAMTQSVFPDAPLHLEIDDDPEIASDRHLAVVVKTTFTDVERSVADRWRWHRELFSCCPAPMAHVFRLGMEFDT